MSHYRPVWPHRFGVTIIVLSLLFLIGCGQQAAPPTSAPAKAAPTTVATVAPSSTVASTPSASSKAYRIGSVSPLSGPAGSIVGIPFARGAEMAIEEVNQAGGITVGGQKYLLELQKYDDKYTAEGGASAVQKAIYEDGLRLLIGPHGSAATLAAQPITEKEKVIINTAAVTDKDVRKDAPYTFQGELSGLECTYDFFRVLRDKFPSVKKVAIVNPNDESGMADTERAAKQYESLGFQVVSKEYYQRTATDFYPTMTKVIASNPDAIDVAAAATPGVLVKQARELGYKGKLWGAGVDSQALIQTGGAASEGFLAYFMSPDYYGPDATPMQKQLGERYKAKYSEPVNNFFFEQSHDITKAWAKAMQAANSFDTDKMAAAIRADGFQWDTVVPDIKGRMTGDKTYGIRSITSSPFYLTEIKNGKVSLFATTTANVP